MLSHHIGRTPLNLRNQKTKRSIPARVVWKMSRALGIALYQLFYEGENPPAPPKQKSVKTSLWGSSGIESMIDGEISSLVEPDRRKCS